MLFILILAGSLLGIAAMVAVNAWLGLSEPARLAGLDDAIHRLDTDSVGFEPGPGGVVSPGGTSALVPAADGATIGLIVARGSDFVIRYLGPGSVRSAEVVDENKILLRLNDFAFAPARLGFDGAAEARDWARRLNGLKG